MSSREKALRSWSSQLTVVNEGLVDLLLVEVRPVWLSSVARAAIRSVVELMLMMFDN
jgi:hypothetical protein